MVRRLVTGVYVVLTRLGDAVKIRAILRSLQLAVSLGASYRFAVSVQSRKNRRSQNTGKSNASIASAQYPPHVGGALQFTRAIGVWLGLPP